MVSSTQNRTTSLNIWNVILDYKKEREINKIEQVLDIEWNADELVQKYLKTLQDARHQLNTLKAFPGTPKMIQKLICVMEQHAEFDKVSCSQMAQENRSPEKEMG